MTIITLTIHVTYLKYFVYDFNKCNVYLNTPIDNRTVEVYK